MAFSVVVAGSSVQLVLDDGTIKTVTLPAGCTVIAGAKARFAILGRNVIIVNAVTKPIWIDSDGVARTLSIPQPNKAPTVAAGGAGSLTGSYKAKVAYVIKDALGRDLMVGPYGTASATVTTTADVIDYSAIPLSGEALVNCRRVARTATGPGTSYFHAFDIDDNTTTTFSDGTSDEALALLPIETDLGSAPARLTQIVEWKGRLWAVNAANIDEVAFSADGLLYAWPTVNTLPVRPIGKDRLGITGFIPRRDELGIGKRDIIWKITGSDTDNFAMVKLIEGKGILAPDSVVVVRDTAYWLSNDGVYTWDENGVRCITDEQVNPWFTTGTYFNRARFPNAFAKYCPLKHAYELHLAPAGSTSPTQWISYDIARKCWLGPHVTAEFTPSAAGVIYDANEVQVPVICSTSGYAYGVTPGTYRDGAATAIALDMTGKFHSGDAPDMEHFWGMLSIFTKIESAGTLTITPKVGRLDASAGAAISHALTAGRRRVRRLGAGALCQLRFTNAELNQACEIYGYEFPFFEIGRR